MYVQSALRKAGCIFFLDIFPEKCKGFPKTSCKFTENNRMIDVVVIAIYEIV